MVIALVALGAALGAPTRWWVDVQVQRRWAPVFPFGTFIVNVVGSALLGIFTAVWSDTSSF
ncbi:MAG TPA: CrcB family protein, partial [Actinomycetes bacterium]|nr:CrcB family protein [Actinomycetes bacterium]